MKLAAALESDRADILNALQDARWNVLTAALENAETDDARAEAAKTALSVIKADTTTTVGLMARSGFTADDIGYLIGQMVGDLMIAAIGMLDDADPLADAYGQGFAETLERERQRAERGL